MSQRHYPNIEARLSAPLMITSEKLDEIRAGLAAGTPGIPGGTKPEQVPAYYLTGSAAVVPIMGTLVRSTGGAMAMSGLTSYSTIAEGFQRALSDERATSVVLHLNSSGGEVAGVFSLADMMFAARGKKPIVALVDERAASAAYLLACAADRIVLASPLAEVGSIGVLLQHRDQSAADEAAGLKYTTLFIGDRKNDGNPHEPLSQEARARLMGHMQTAYEEFVRRVAAFRKLSEAAVVGTKAAIYHGDGALAAKLADTMQAPADLLAQLGDAAPSYNPEMSAMKTLTAPGAALPSGDNIHVAIAMACTNAGFPELTAPLLQSGSDMPAVERVLADAAAISDACHRLRVPQMKASLVQAVATGVPLQTLRDMAANTAAARDESIVTDTTRPAGLGAATYDNPNFRAGAFADALFARFNPGMTVPEQARPFVGMSIPEVAREVLQRSGQSALGMTPARAIQAALQTTGDFPLILSGFAEKTLRRAYQVAPSGLKMIAREGSATNFKDVHRLAAGEFPSLEKVNEAGEFKHGGFRDSGETYRLATYGKIIGLTRQALVNDDLTVFHDTTRRIALAAAEFEALQLALLINSNPAMRDGNPVFHADRGNIAAVGGAINADTLSAGRKAMRLQKGVDGQVFINTAPKFIVVNPERETEAEKAVAAITPSSTSEANPFTGLTPVVDPRLSGGENGGAWYIAGDPNIIDGIEYAYLDGQRGPRTETQNGFDYDGVQIKVALDYGCGWLDFRGWHKNPGN